VKSMPIDDEHCGRASRARQACLSCHITTKLRFLARVRAVEFCPTPLAVSLFASTPPCRVSALIAFSHSHEALRRPPLSEYSCIPRTIKPRELASRRAFLRVRHPVTQGRRIGLLTLYLPMSSFRQWLFPLLSSVRTRSQTARAHPLVRG